MSFQWLLRMRRWLQHPASALRVKLVLATIVICLVLAGIEHIFGWPDWLSLQGGPRAHRLPKL